MNKTKFYFAAVFILLANQVVFAANHAMTMTYKNTHGSLLELNINQNNILTGFFTTAVASKECQQAIGLKRPITGYIIADVLAFSVSYPGCGVITLIGNIEDNKKTIDTVGLVAHATNHIVQEWHGAKMISHDIFTKI